MDNEKKDNSLKENILQRIEKENVCPRSRYWFDCFEYLTWVFWFLAVMVGSLSIAVSLYFIKYNYYSLFEATHDNFFGFLLEALPYLWFFVLGLMLFWAIINLRHTKRGYRYPLWQILTMSLSFSIFGGLVLYVAGVGFSFDRWLGDSVLIYESREKIAKRFWQKPEDGRLIGVFVESYSSEDKGVLVSWFEDVSGVLWQINESEITDIDKELLHTQKIVKLIGYKLSKEMESEAGIFHVCGVLPWVYEKEESMKHLELRQKMARERLWRYKKPEELLDIDGMGGDSFVRSLCSEIKIVDRLYPIMSR